MPCPVPMCLNAPLPQRLPCHALRSVCTACSPWLTCILLRASVSGSEDTCPAVIQGCFMHSAAVSLRPGSTTSSLRTKSLALQKAQQGEARPGRVAGCRCHAMDSQASSAATQNCLMHAPHYTPAGPAGPTTHWVVLAVQSVTPLLMPRLPKMPQTSPGGTHASLTTSHTGSSKLYLQRLICSNSAGSESLQKGG